MEKIRNVCSLALLAGLLFTVALFRFGLAPEAPAESALAARTVPPSAAPAQRQEQPRPTTRVTAPEYSAATALEGCPACPAGSSHRPQLPGTPATAAGAQASAPAGLPEVQPAPEEEALIREKLAPFERWAQRLDTPEATVPEAHTLETGKRLALQRREALKQLIRSDPQSALRQALPFAIRNRLPPEIQALVEQPVSGKGDLLVAIGLRFGPGAQPAYQYLAQFGPAQTYQAYVYGRRAVQTTLKNVSLHGVAVDGELAVSESPLRVLEPGEPPSAGKAQAQKRCPVSGTEVTLAAGTGTSSAALIAESGDQVHFLCSGQHLASLSSQVTAQEEVMAAAPLASGDLKAAVILVNLTNASLSSSCTPAAVNDLMFLSASSVSACYRETSFNQMWFSGNTYGKYTINYDSSVSNYTQIANAANTAATAAGVDLTPYWVKVYIVPPCTMFSNFGGGTVGVATNVGTFVRGDYWSGKQVHAHELGHMVGMAHASTPTNEYGDYSDLMGNSGSLTQVNGPHKVQMGWTSGANVITTSSSGTYTLSLLEQAGLGPQVLKILKPDGPYTYYFSYRVPVGFDAALPSTYTYRLNVHKMYENQPSEVVIGGVRTVFQTALADGGTFTDSTNGITVTMPSHTSTHASVGVVFEPRSGLSGHWKLDEGAGTIAGDSSAYGNKGTLTNGPVWTTGKVGGALSFDGLDDSVIIPGSESMAVPGKQRNCTLAGWFRPDTVPASGTAYAVAMRSGAYAGLAYTSGKRFSMQHRVKVEVDASATGAAAHEPGSFYHVAGVVDRAAGTTKVYVNGVLEGTASWTPNAETETGVFSWGELMLGNVKTWNNYPAGYKAADGTIDDVRLYHRALTAAEIATLAGAPKALKRDFDGDGKADVLFRHSSSGEVLLWLMK